MGRGPAVRSFGGSPGEAACGSLASRAYENNRTSEQTDGAARPADFMRLVHHGPAAYASIASWSCCICSSCIMAAPHMLVLHHGRCAYGTPPAIVRPMHHDHRAYGTPPAIGHALPASCKRHKLPYTGKGYHIHPAKAADFRGTARALAPGGGPSAAWHASCFLFGPGRHDGRPIKPKREKST